MSGPAKAMVVFWGVLVLVVNVIAAVEQAPPPVAKSAADYIVLGVLIAFNVAWGAAVVAWVRESR